MRATGAWVAAMLAVGCVPEYDPLRDADVDAADVAVTCEAVPPPYADLTPWIRESETGYDHRAGVGDDRGVIHHEAFVSRRPSDNTMLTLQDYRGPEADRSPGTVQHLEDEFSSTADPEFLDCELCVLFLEDCPYESLGGCARVYLAVGGTITFDAFDKGDDAWSQDTLAELAVRMDGLRFREVVIDPETFATEPACPTHVCPDAAGGDGDCFVVDAYRFSYVAEP